MQPLNSATLGARFYLNGFPKSGLHLLAGMMYPIAHQMPRDWMSPWVSMFQRQSFTEERAPIDRISFGLARIHEGYYMKGHCGYDDALERYMYYAGLIHLFVYRDFRDVAVSQAYHIADADNEWMFHPAKAMYQDLGGFDEILSAVIQGIDIYPGVMQRWEHYAPWLDVDWTLGMKFSVLRNKPTLAAHFIIEHMLARLTKILRVGVSKDEKVLKYTAVAMAQSGKQRKISPTFRKGKVGDWKKHFTPAHVDQFKESDKNNWLVRLGFANEDWNVEE